MANHPNRNWRKHAPHSLVRSWLEMNLDAGLTRAEALRLLNDGCAACYTNSRLNEWLRGDRGPDHAARVYMLRAVLPYVLHQNGVAADTLRNAQLNKIADDLS